MTMIEAPKPGVYKGQSEAYYTWDAMNNTGLGWMKDNAAVYQYNRTHPQDSTDAMTFGTKFHRAVLDNEWPEAPTTQKGRNELEALKGMHAAVYADPLLSAMLSRIKPENRELAIVWDDVETGVRCKALLDSIFPYEENGVTKFCILDLKSTADASPREFQKSFYNYGYHRQSAHYWEAGLSVPLDIGKFVFGAVEKTAPYPVICYEVDHDARMLGFWERHKLLRRFVECREKNEWPGYSDGKQFHTITLPGWAKKEIEAL